MTRGAFFKKFAAMMSIPWTEHNRRVFAAWAQAEGGAARFNPVNTTQTEPGATTYNFAGVKNYPDAETGLRALKTTFGYPGHGYGAILAAMRENKPARETLRLIGASDWGTAGTLGIEVLGDIQRKPSYLRTLERKEIAS